MKLKKPTSKQAPERITVRLNSAAHMALQVLMDRYPMAPYSELVNRLLVICAAKQEPLTR